MNNTPPCEIAGTISIIEKRLRNKSKLATSDFCVAGYAQAALEIAREGLNHFRQCELCQSIEAATASDWQPSDHSFRSSKTYSRQAKGMGVAHAS